MKRALSVVMLAAALAAGHAVPASAGLIRAWGSPGTPSFDRVAIDADRGRSFAFRNTAVESCGVACQKYRWDVAVLDHLGRVAKSASGSGFVHAAAVDRATGLVYFSIGARIVALDANLRFVRHVFPRKVVLDIAIDATAGVVYAVEQFDTVVVFDRFLRLRGWTFIDRGAGRLTVDERRRRAYLPHSQAGSGRIYSIGTDGRVLARIPTGTSGAWDLCLSGIPGRLYASVYTGGDPFTRVDRAELLLVDAARGVVVRRTDAPGVGSVACGPNGFRVLLAARHPDGVHSEVCAHDGINLQRVACSQVAGSPGATAVDEPRNRYFVGSSRWGLYTFNRSATLTGMHDEGGAGWPIAVRAAANRVVVGGWLVLMDANDSTPPRTTVTWPPETGAPAPPPGNIEGLTVAEGAGFRAADVLYRPLDSGGRWFSSVAEIRSCDSAWKNECSWTAALPSEPGRYEAIARSYDVAGNAEPEPVRREVVVA